MGRFLPHPLLSLCMVLMWMVLTRFSTGHLLLGTAIGLFTGWTMTALHPEKPMMHNLRIVPRLAAVLFVDIIRSNIAVARLIVAGRGSTRRSSFVEVPLKLRSPTGLAVLAVILTATPGTAWIEYNAGSGTLILHVFDGAESERYTAVIRNVYEPMLQEIFE